MTGRITERSLRAGLWSVVFLAVLALPRWALANGSDLPPEVVLQGFVKPEDGRIQLLLRLPLSLLANFSPPKRGPGYLELDRINTTLRQVAAATGRQIELSVDGKTLAPTTRELRLSLSSDRSFASYASALAHLQGPPLPADTDLFWNQGFLDLRFEYQVPSPSPNIWIRANVPELGNRLKLRLEYLPIGEPARSLEIAGDAGWIPLNPRWYDAAWLFVKGGFADAFTLERFLFILCLVAPFRRFSALLAIVVAYTALQALTLTAAAGGALADAEIGWLPLLFITVYAAAVLLLAIGNLAVPRLRARYFIASVVGAFAGFGLGRLLTDASPFMGTHPLVAVVAFNVGVALGVVACLIVAFVALRLLFSTPLGPLLGVIVVSALLGHASWHWMIDGGREFMRQLGQTPPASFWSALAVVVPWLIPALVVGIAAYFLPKRFDGVPVPTLLRALHGNPTD
jgi:HupE / UreJ protein